MSRLNVPSFAIWQQLSHAVWRGNDTNTVDRKAIYVDLFHDSFDYLIYSLHVGRLIGLETGLPVIGLTGKLGVVHGSCPNFNPDEVIAIARGFDVDVIHLAEKPFTGPAIDWVAREAKRQGVDLPTLSGVVLRNFLRAARFESDFPIGRYIYETHLRNEKTETILNFDGPLLKNIERCLFVDSEIRKQLDALPAAWFVVGHVDYTPWSLAAARILERGGKVAYFRNEGNVRIHLVNGALQGGETVFGRVRRTGAPVERAMIDRLVAEMPDVIENHFRAVGTGARFRVHHFVDAPMADIATSSSRRIERAIRARLGIDDGRPVIGVFTVTFSDIPLTDEQVFENSYYWLLETLTFAASRSDIRWLVKIHPYDLAYNVTGAMERLKAQFASHTHIRFIEEGWPPTVIILACDVVTSVRGTPGMQAATIGRPTVFCGHGQYSDLGFATLATTKAEYFHALTQLAHAPAIANSDTARARAFRYLEDVVLANTSSFLGSFGELAAASDPWDEMTKRLRWYAPETDPLLRAIGEAIRSDAPRVGYPSQLDDVRTSKSAPVPGVHGGGHSIRSAWPPGIMPLFGFHSVEPWGVWMGAGSAAVLIRVTGPASGLLRLRITCMALIPPEWPVPSMAVTVDGIVGVAAPSTDQAPGELVFDFGPAIFGEDRQLLVEFALDGGTVPNAVHSNGDTRHLTFSFQDIAWQIIPQGEHPPQN